jgi:hypothetical protein
VAHGVLLGSGFFYKRGLNDGVRIADGIWKENLTELGTITMEWHAKK